MTAPERPEQAAADSEGGQPGDWPAPHWDVRVNSSGLTATLVGLEPPIVVSARDLEALKEKVRGVMFVAML